MKKMMVVLFVATLAFTAGAEQLDHWVYDATAKTVSDGVWTFPASVNVQGLQVSKIDSKTFVSPEEISPIDLTKPFVDSVDGTKTYQLYNFDPRLGNNAKIGAINVNCPGLKSIGYNCFNNAKNATGELVFPSSLTSMGSYPFEGTKLWMKGDALPAGYAKLDNQALQGLTIEGELDLTHITQADWGGARYITAGSVRFGPNLTLLNNWTGAGWSQRNILGGNSSLTNVVFDPSSSVAVKGGYVFANSTVLTELDLSAFTSIELAPTVDTVTRKSWGLFNGCTKLRKVTFSHKLTRLDAETFYNAPALEEIRFKGPPPATLETPFLAEVPDSQNVITVVELDKNSTDYDYATALAAWNALTAGGTINEEDSTWSEAAAGSAYASRPLILHSVQTISLTKTGDLDQATKKSGGFVISRGAEDSLAANIVVNYSVSGTAVAGKDYVALDGSVTILAGVRSVSVTVDPLYNMALTDPRTIVVTLQKGDFELGVSEATIIVSKSKAFDGWIYDKTAGTITRGDWTFGATVADKTTNMTVGKWQAVPETTQPLDFSPLVVDSDGVFYQIVQLHTQFGWKNESKAYRTGGYEPQASRVGKLTLPEGLVKFGDYAFAACTNLDPTVDFPATLQETGISTFACTPLAGDIVMTNLTLLKHATFAGTKITSCQFGPDFVTFDINYDRGPFQNCKQLTNVVFDAASSITMLGQFAFQGSTALQELDLRAFRAFQDPTKTANSAFKDCSNLKRITVGNVPCVYPYTFSGTANLEEIVFVDMPPVGTFTNYLSGASASKTIVTRVSKKYLDVPNAAGVCWRDLAVGGEIRRRGTTWKSDYLVSGVDPVKRPLLLLEPYGLQIILK